MDIAFCMAIVSLSKSDRYKVLDEDYLKIFKLPGLEVYRHPCSGKYPAKPKQVLNSRRLQALPYKRRH